MKKEEKSQKTEKKYWIESLNSLTLPLIQKMSRFLLNSMN